MYPMRGANRSHAVVLPDLGGPLTRMIAISNPILKHLAL